MKECIKCKITKDLSCFPKDKRLTSGYRKKCKECYNEHQKQLRRAKPEQYSNMRKRNYQKNIDKMRLEKRKYYADNKEAKSLYDMEYREKNKEKIAAYKKEWDKKQTQNNIIHKIKKNLRRRVHHALNGKTKSASTMKLIGCTPEYFKEYIESLFLENMSWNNYGEWHIDHIIPCFAFDLSIPEQQQKCFHYSNQRPLWKKDNLKRPKSIEQLPIVEYLH